MKVNAIRCKNCNTIIYSRAEHDFHWCPCGRCAVDGGFDYFKIVGNREDWEVVDFDVLDDVPVGEAKNILYSDWNFNENKFGTKVLSAVEAAAFDPLFASKEGQIERENLKPIKVGGEPQPDGTCLYNSDIVDSTKMSGVVLGCENRIDDGSLDDDWPSSVDEVKNGYRSW